MKSIDQTTYFTAGEVASLFGISKQALLYYDKVNLLSPEYISENGYRHYCISQLMDLEVVLNLRSMDFSISCIKSYLQDKNLQKLEHLLEKKAADCQETIRINQNILDSIHKIKSDLNSFANLEASNCTIKYYSERLIANSPIRRQHSPREKLACYTKHSNATLTYKGMISKKVGWIIDAKAFFQNQSKLPSKAYFSICPDAKESSYTQSGTLPKGFYLEVFSKGPFYSNHQKIYQTISTYLADNKLDPDSDVYVMPIKNHWFTSDISEYITKVFLKIKEQ